MIQKILKLEIEFVILWDDKTWEDCNFEEYEIDLNNNDHYNSYGPTPQYFDNVCEKYEFLRNTKLTTPLGESIVKAIVYNWRWLNENDI